MDLVVPDGFTGGILVRRGERDSERLARVKLVVPPDGVVASSDGAWIAHDGWVYGTCQFAGGTHIPDDTSNEKIGDEVVAFRDTALATEEGIWFFVGTRAQFEQFMSNPPKPGAVLSHQPIRREGLKADGEMVVVASVGGGVPYTALAAQVLRTQRIDFALDGSVQHDVLVWPRDKAATATALRREFARQRLPIRIW